ncbi:MAG: sugar kinase [Pseudomonadota bacterium]
MTRIACVGEVMVELSPEGPDTLRQGVAGDTFNTAVYLRRALPAGTDVAYVTALGDDAQSDAILNTLTAERLSTSLVERRAGMMPGLYMISVDEGGERSFSYWRSAAAARTLFQAPCTVTPADMAGFDIVYLSGISVAILPPATRDALLTWIDGYRQAGGRLAYDSNYRPRLWEDRATAQATSMQFWRRADIALPSVDDEMDLFGDADAAAVLARLTGAGATFGALKRGAVGPISLVGDALTPPPAPVTTVVDSTAAGDSFNAGFLAALVQGGDIQACMRAGHTLAARVIQHRGAILPT